MEVDPSNFQKRVLRVPEAIDLFLGGGRGGGKSYALALIGLRHIEQYGTDGRVLFIRRTHKALADFEALTRSLFGAIYGSAARFNSSEGFWRFPNGGFLELSQMQGHEHYSKFQGRSFSLLMVDEAQQYPDPSLLDLLRSNLRGPKGVPIRTVMAANPGGVGHHWLLKRFIHHGKPWVPFTEETSAREVVVAPSVYTDNEHIDQAEYRQQLEAACATDPELLKAWLSGSWFIARGAFFGDVIDEKRNLIEPWQSVPQGWETWLAHDYGSAAPSVTYVCAKSPGAKGPDKRWYPKGSVILLDELATNKPGDLSRGLGWTIPILSDAILELCERWNVKPQGVADDACFSQHGHGSGSIADEFRHHGIAFTEAKKGRRGWGWELMRTLLQGAGQPDVPGVYVSRNCQYFWQTVPFLGRDPKRLDDVDSSGPDHGADAARYALLHKPKQVKEIKLMGL